MEKGKKKGMKPGVKKFLSHLVAFLFGLGAVFVPPEFRPMALPVMELLEDGIQDAIEEAPEASPVVEVVAKDSDSDTDS
jgi:hypothetical protein